MALDLKKIDERKGIVLNLKKEKGIENQKAQVALCMDISGSMSSLYRSGYVQQVIERLVPVALQFDDNGELDLYMFSDSCKKHKNNVTLANLDGFVQNEIMKNYNFGGTEYAPPINLIRKEVENSGKSFLGFGGGSKPKKLKYPIYVIFITDGENADKNYAEEAIREASKYGIFFQFVGIGNAAFSFLEKLDNLSGRFIDNANFFKVPDLNRMSDADLYSQLLNEFPSWLTLAKQNNLIEP